MSVIIAQGLKLVDSISDILESRALIYSLTKREIISKYKGSIIGALWAFINPILMMAIYTFVFSVVFKSRWGESVTSSKTEYALALFIGLIVFTIFSECLNRAPTLIISNVNYVKKVVFPIEILPIVVMGSALFQTCISLIVWVLFYISFIGIPTLNFFWFPLILFPFLLQVLGISWFLSSLGVYLRDTAQVIGILVMIMMYMSPVFYSVSMLPKAYQSFMHLSPLTYIIEQSRNSLMFGQGIEWSHWFIYTLISCFVMLCGFAWFKYTRKGFADVV